MAAALTTIAYHPSHGIAADRQISQRRTIVGKTTKIGRAASDRFLWGAAGHLTFISDLREWLTSGPNKPKHRGPPDKDAWLEEMPVPKKGDEALIADILDPGRIFAIDATGIEVLDVPYFALGSGRDFALGALAVGAHPRDSIAKAAMGHCTMTGGGVDFLPWEAET